MIGEGPGWVRRSVAVHVFVVALPVVVRLVTGRLLAAARAAPRRRAGVRSTTRPRRALAGRRSGTLGPLTALVAIAVALVGRSGLAR